MCVCRGGLISDAAPRHPAERDYLAYTRATRLLVYYADKLRWDIICHPALIAIFINISPSPDISATPFH